MSLEELVFREGRSSSSGLSHMLQVRRIPVHHPQAWQLGIAGAATSSIPVSGYHVWLCL